MTFWQKNKTGILMTIIVVLAVALIASLAILHNAAPTGLQQGSLSDEPVSDVGATDFAASINSNIIVSDGVANLRIENTEKNHEACIVTLYDENNEAIYESPIIPTGYYIETAKLQKELPVGQYEGTAVFEVLGADENTVKSTLTVDVDIRVK